MGAQPLGPCAEDHRVSCRTAHYDRESSREPERVAGIQPRRVKRNAVCDAPPERDRSLPCDTDSPVERETIDGSINPDFVRLRSASKLPEFPRIPGRRCGGFLGQGPLEVLDWGTAAPRR